MTDNQTLAFQTLSPDAVLTAIESIGYECDGRLLALNSYENRVYQVGLEVGTPIVAKFYRPNRWSNEQILEEHAFAFELVEADIPVVPPIRGEAGETLHQYDDFRFSVFKRRGGRAPELDNPDQLEIIGRFIGRLHTVGATRSFSHRPALTVQSYGIAAKRFVLDNGFIPLDIEVAYDTVTDDLLARIENCYERAGNIKNIRLHADCHVGNFLWADDVPHIVDLDDARMGPAVQDIWMFLSGDRSYQTARLMDFLEGYEQFADFDPRELHLVEALRSLRLMHYYGWLAKRWEDPAFKQAFTWFDSQKCWEQHVLDLREQISLLDEAPLSVGNAL